MPPTITALYAGILGILLVVLGFRVAMRRMDKRVGLGDGDDVVLRRRVRIHGNAAEHVPMAVLLLLINELVGVAPTWLHAFGATLVVARVLHAVGLSYHSGSSFGRFVGILATWATMLGMAIMAILRFFGLP
jgi:hypothetical protein